MDVYYYYKQRISKELKKLQFSNPGEKMRANSSTVRWVDGMTTPPSLIMSQILLFRRARGPGCQGSGGEDNIKQDFCDCLNMRCPGCFLPCIKCR